MSKKYEIDALCNIKGCDSPVVHLWHGRYYCAKHDPLPAPPKKAQKPAPERSAAERAKKTAAQKRWREKRRQEHAAQMALLESKRTS